MKWGVVITLLIVAATGWFFSQQGDDKGKAEQAMPVWQAIDTQKVSHIEIRQDAQPAVILSRQGDSWHIDHQLADETSVQRLLDDIAAMRPERVVTRKRNHDAELGLDAKGIHLLLKDSENQLLMDAIIGKQGANLTSTYLRLQAEDAVYAMNRSLLWQLRRTSKAWQKVLPPAASTPPALTPYANHAPYRMPDNG